jgi:hypothetical protein
MSDFNPGPGWRQVDKFPGYDHEHVAAVTPQGKSLYWVREPPVPPLPTAPYTVIRAWWGTDTWSALTLAEDGAWLSARGNAYNDDELAQMVRFEVLSEPRAVTAKAVLDAIRECAPLNMELRTDPVGLGTEDPQTAAYVEGVHAAYDSARQEFGVTDD